MEYFIARRCSASLGVYRGNTHAPTGGHKTSTGAIVKMMAHSKQTGKKDVNKIVKIGIDGMQKSVLNITMWVVCR